MKITASKASYSTSIKSIFLFDLDFPSSSQPQSIIKTVCSFKFIYFASNIFFRSPDISLEPCQSLTHALVFFGFSTCFSFPVYRVNHRERERVEKDSHLCVSGKRTCSINNRKHDQTGQLKTTVSLFFLLQEGLTLRIQIVVNRPQENVAFDPKQTGKFDVNFNQTLVTFFFIEQGFFSLIVRRHFSSKTRQKVIAKYVDVKCRGQTVLLL